MEIRIFRSDEIEEVLTLWERCDSITVSADPELDIERKLRHHPELFLVAELAGEIVGTVMGGYDGLRASLYYLAVHPEYRGRGVGNALLNRLEKKLKALGCSKLTLELDEEADLLIGFYQKLNYDIVDTLVMQKQLLNDQDS